MKSNTVLPILLLTYLIPQYAYAEKKIEIKYAGYSIADSIVNLDIKITNHTKEASDPIKLLLKAMPEPYDPSNNQLNGSSLIESSWPAFDGDIKNHTLEVDKPLSKMKTGIYYLTVFVSQCNNTSGEEICSISDYYSFPAPINVDAKTYGKIRLSDNSAQPNSVNDTHTEISKLASKTDPSNQDAEVKPLNQLSQENLQKTNNTLDGTTENASKGHCAESKTDCAEACETVGQEAHLSSQGTKLTGLGLVSFPARPIVKEGRSNTVEQCLSECFSDERTCIQKNPS